MRKRMKKQREQQKVAITLVYMDYYYKKDIPCL